MKTIQLLIVLFVSSLYSQENEFAEFRKKEKKSESKQSFIESHSGIIERHTFKFGPTIEFSVKEPKFHTDQWTNELWNGFGTDLSLPKTVMKDVVLKTLNLELSFPAELISDLGNPGVCNLARNDVKMSKKGRVVTIFISNSDGAGYYETVFTIDLQKMIVDRHIWEEGKGFAMTHAKQKLASKD